jgi:hypothetical protein
MSKIVWHYSRDGLARTVLDALTDGGATAITMFAPRRRGKTEFLLRDLGPLAAERGLAVVYASFWQTYDDPPGVLEHAIRTSAEKPGLWARATDAVRAARPKLRIAPAGIGGEIDLAGRADQPTADHLLRLDDLIEGLPATPRKPALLMLDEVQELAAEAHRGFVAALRTSLDRRRDRLRVVFTGSSVDGLRAMFSDREAPFFHFGTNLDLPSLDDGFVTHMLAAHRAASGRDLDEDAARRFFEGHDRSPFMLRSVLERLALDRTEDFEAAARLVLDDLAERSGYGRIWRDLTPLQRAVLVAVARETRRLTATDARARIASRIGEADAVSPGRISGALRTLSRLSLIHKTGKGWAMADPDMGRFVRQAEA